ncbi:MAG: PIG-L deacetylase family protein [Dermatophilaceae bacterium]
MAALERARRVLVVVAHPDDESFGTGSLLLHLAGLGAATFVCCASRGEAGDVVEAVAVPPGGVGALRETELRAAAELLGVREVRLLGVLDSGMTGQPAPDTIVGTDPAVLARSVSDVVREVRPHALVTLDGSDGHRDHVRMREVTEAVGREFGLPVWLHCLPRALMRAWAQRLAGLDPESPYLALGELGTDEARVTDRIDTTAYLPRRLAAISVHASQHSPYAGLPADLRDAFLTRENLIGPVGDVRPLSPESLRHRHDSGCHWNHRAAAWACP